MSTNKHVHFQLLSLLLSNRNKKSSTIHINTHILLFEMVRNGKRQSKKETKKKIKTEAEKSSNNSIEKKKKNKNRKEEKKFQTCRVSCFYTTEILEIKLILKYDRRRCWFC